MNLLRSYFARRPGKEGVHVRLLKLIGTPAELTGHG
jgi:hypothetical protein